MTVKILQEHQFSCRHNYLYALHQDCVRKFRTAAFLIGLDVRQWPNVDKFYKKTVNFSPLYDFWNVICGRYNREIFDGQKDFFDEDDPTVLFSEFVYHRLWRTLVSDNEVDVTRNVLRAVMTIPCNDPEVAVNSLIFHVKEMRFDMRMNGQGFNSWE